MEARNTPYRTLLHTLRGHEEEINRIAWSPDGQQRLASASFDGTVRIWDTQNGTLQQTLRGHSGAVYSVSWSPDGQLLASCSQDGRVLGWEYAPENRILFGVTHKGNVYDSVWLPYNNSFLASCSEDQRVAIWNISLQQENKKQYVWNLRGYFSGIFSLAYIDQYSQLASGSSKGPIHLWRLPDAKFLMKMARSEGRYLIAPSSEVEEYWRVLRGSPSRTLRGHTEAVYSLAWTPHTKLLASASEDKTIRLWDLETELVTHMLEWHTASITSVSFSYDGRLLASKSRDGIVALWRTDTWELVDTIETPASNGVFAGLDFHPNQPLLATVSESDRAVQVWQLNIPALLGLKPLQPTVHYVNAKVVLAGDSNVGKTCVGRALVGLPYIQTDSTHGRFVYTFKSYTVDLAEGRQEQREVFLWDLAGQPGSRLVHQLHLPDAAAVLLVFSEMNAGDPLVGIRYWARALRAIQSTQAGRKWNVARLLVEARRDAGGVRLNKEQIHAELQRWGMIQYYPTSAQLNQGISELARGIEEAIAWEKLPKVSSTELFQRIKAFLVERKKAGHVVELLSNLYRDFVEQAGLTVEPPHLREQFETCVGHLDVQGLLRRLSFGGQVLLLPEKLDAYADALVRKVRSEEEQLGSILEADVLAGQFTLSEDVRLHDQQEENILLLTLVQDLLAYEIALRENADDGSSYLVFPSEVMRQPQANDPQQPFVKTIRFTFEGPILNIYATLAVRLTHSGFFRKWELWQNCMTLTAQVGGTCRFDLRTPDDGIGEILLSFDDQASEETRYHFETYIQNHVQKYARESFQRQRLYVCPICQTPLSDAQVTRGRELHREVLACPMMDEGRINIRDGLARLPHTPDTEIQTVMELEADASRERAVAQTIVQGKELTRQHDVYISYHPQDEQAARNLAESLRERGYRAWLVDWDSIPGLPRQSQIEESIRYMRAAAVLFGKHEMDSQRELENAALLEQFKQRNCRIMPVVLADAPANLHFPPFLQQMVEVDFRRSEPDPLERLIMGIENKRI